MAREKVAILGGGVGGMTAAFALTEGENAGRYDVTVYQLGWRLGGKGASGRNRRAGERIEEHGLHIWFGFYYTALPLMQRCYAELTGDREAWKDAFDPHDYVVLEEFIGGKWCHLPMAFPPRPGKLLSPAEFVREILHWIRDAIGHGPIWPLADATAEGWLPPARARLHAALGHPSPEAARGFHLLHEAVTATEHLLAEAWADVGEVRAVIRWMVERFRAWLAARVAVVASVDDAVRRLWLAVDLGVTVIRGMLADDVLDDGFDSIDDVDFQDWLRSHGAAPEAVDSAWVRSLYSLAFAFLDGDVTRRSMGAGTILRGTLRMLFAYDGTVMWKMQAGMGDVVFAPLYKVLRQRGVQFRFFHRVRKLHLSADRKSIERISLGRQLRVKAAEYSPLVDVNGRWCWPNAPDYAQIDDAQVARLRALEQDPRAYVNLESAWSSWGEGEEDEVVLERGRADELGFDHVVLAIPPPALRRICEDLVAVSPDWRRMVDGLKTVRTQAFQLWLTARLVDVWDLPSPVCGAYIEPIDTWADMSHLIAAEKWPAGTVRLLAYFCGVMPESGPEPAWFTDPSFPRKKTEEAYAAMLEHLKNNMGYMWRATAAEPNSLDWTLLHDPSGATGSARLRSQYWVANIDPSERYVLSVPGTTRHRLPKPGKGTGFRNFYLAGDWTRNGLNAGCVEAAVMSGLQASRALSGNPDVIVGETDF